VQLVLVQLIDHEADDAFAGFGHHADAVALAQTADEIVFVPRKLEALLLDREHFGHIAADHPTNVNGERAPLGKNANRILRPGHTVLLASIPARAAKLSGGG
jgi:hypothetical protein